MNAQTWADMALGFIFGLSVGGVLVAIFVHRQNRAVSDRWQRILDPTRGYLDEE